MIDSKNSKDLLSIGIVTYNCRDHILKTLDSLYLNLPNSADCRIYVHDNGSTDGTIAAVKNWSANKNNIHFFESTRNVGFGCGHNKIFKRTRSDYHLVCNPDIIIGIGVLDVLLKFMRKNEKLGIACPRVHFPDGRLQPLNRRHPTLWDLALRRLVSASVQRYFKTRMDRYNMLDVGYEESYQVPFVSGAFMICRSAALRQVNCFDERYFLYFEDADLSRKMQAHSWLTAYCPEAVVVHQWQREAHKSLKGALLFSHSAFKYFNKWGWRFC